MTTTETLSNPLTTDQILAASPTSDWQPVDPAETLYLDIPAGRVVIALAPAFAPNHVANIKALSRECYFDGLPITRVQDNFVVQWGVFDGTKEIRTAKRTLPAEFDRPLAGAPAFTPLPDRDVYAPSVGFADNLPSVRDFAAGRMWLAHCYSMVGVARFDAADSGGGIALYAVIGHAPRFLDRNATLVGRVVHGIELLSALPRGTGSSGFYEKAQQRVPIIAARIASDLPASEHLELEVLRTDSATFQAVVESRRNCRHPWFKVPAGHIDLGNVPLPVRVRKIEGRPQLSDPA